MNFFMRVVFAAVVYGCASSSSHVIAMSDEQTVFCDEVDFLHYLQPIYLQKRSLINLWKSGFIILEDSQGKPLDMIQFMKALENYCEKDGELDPEKVTVKNVNKVLAALK